MTNSKRIFVSYHGYEFKPINDLFRPHDFIRPVVPLMVVNFFLLQFDSQVAVSSLQNLPAPWHDVTILVYAVLNSFRLSLL
jgi:hypothetical protein